MQQVVFPLVVVQHATGLGLDGDAAFSLDIQLVQNLLVAAGFDGASQLQQAVAERALAMVDMGDDAEVPEAVDGNCGNAAFEVGLRAYLNRGGEEAYGGRQQSCPETAGSYAGACNPKPWSH